MPFTEDESLKAMTYARNGAMFMYRSGEQLSREILEGGPASKGLPIFLKEMIMVRDWINIDSKMVLKYCTKTLDRKNTYIFDKGDIKVIPEPWSLIKI